jgi:hypothetical protein
MTKQQKRRRQKELTLEQKWKRYLQWKKKQEKKKEASEQ